MTLRNLLPRLTVLLLSVATTLTGYAVANEQPRSERPNFLIVLADDLGYSDLGCYGSEIETPNLDRLAADGLRYSQFYNTARCWPTRAALLTGFYAQQVQRDTLPGSTHGGHGKRPAWAQLLPQMLATRGYRSYHSGKWHIDSTPLKTGFDHAYTVDDHDRYFSPKFHTRDGVGLPPIGKAEEYFATTAIADFAIECLTDHAAEYPDAPFFQYVAFNAPHFPLHALPADIQHYADRYRVGWDVIRSERWKRMQSLGIASGTLSQLEPQIGPPYHFSEAIEQLGDGEVNREVPWESLTDVQRAFQAQKMAIHAAMIHRMDIELGRIIEHLRAADELENTAIFFLSDNGASAEIMIRGDGHDPQAPPGSAESYLCLGPGWSSAANTPFRRHKTWVHEGGIATPLIVHWPASIAARGQWRREVGHVIDIAPTVLELAGATRTEWDESAKVPEAPGVSLVDTFAEDRPLDRDFLWWLHEGNRAIRRGDWKLVAAKDEPWELYNLASDRAETSNLAETHREKVADLAKRWTDMQDSMVQRIAQQSASARNPGRRAGSGGP